MFDLPQSEAPAPASSGAMPETPSVTDGVKNILPERHTLPPAETRGEFFVYQRTLAPGMRLEHYEIISVLGNGGFGITYLAKDLVLNRTVVIKENFPSACSHRDPLSGHVRPNNDHDLEAYNWSLKNFLSEAKTLAELNHPGIVKILLVFETNGTAYFAMEHITGLSLDYLGEKLHAHNQHYTEDELKGLLFRLLKILDYLHGKKIYHRDIKPANILLTEEGKPILIDFGAARHSLNLNTGSLLGTECFSAPEQALGLKNVGTWSDIYSLGATFYDLITGEPPERSEIRLNNDNTLPLHTNPQLLHLYSKKFLKSIDKALAPQVEHRYQSAEEWIKDLSADSTQSTATIPLTHDEILQARPEYTNLPGTDDTPASINSIDYIATTNHRLLKRNRQITLMLVGALCAVLLGIGLFFLMDFLHESPPGTTLHNIGKVINKKGDNATADKLPLNATDIPKALSTILVPELATAEGSATEKKEVSHFNIKLSDTILSTTGLPDPLPPEVRFSCIYLDVSPIPNSNVYLTVRTKKGELVAQSVNPLPSFSTPGQTTTSFFFPSLPSLQTRTTYTYSFEAYNGENQPVQLEVLKSELTTSKDIFPKILITAAPALPEGYEAPNTEQYLSLKERIAHPNDTTVKELLPSADSQLDLYRHLSMEGYPVAQFILARTLMNKGGDEAEEGAKWLYHSALGGSYAAMKTLGIMLLDIPSWFPEHMQQPKLLRRNYAQAARFLKMTLQYHNPDILYLISLLYSQGWGVPESSALAAELLKHVDKSYYMVSKINQDMDIAAFWLPLPENLRRKAQLRFFLPAESASTQLRKIRLHNTCTRHSFSLHKITILQKNEVILDIWTTQEPEVKPGESTHSMDYFIPAGLLTDATEPVEVRIILSPGQASGVVEMPRYHEEQPEAH